MSVKFSNEEKIKLFDQISQMYYQHNFGSTNKTDFETLIFSAYLDHCIESKDEYDDYTISKELGISQQKVRSLKERTELKYPYVGDKWKDLFCNCLSTAKLSGSGDVVTIIVEDINVKKEIKHYIETHGWLDLCSLNNKALNLPLECCIDLCDDKKECEAITTEEFKKKIKKFERNNSTLTKFIKEATEDGMKTAVKKLGIVGIKEIIPMLVEAGINGSFIEFISNLVQ